MVTRGTRVVGVSIGCSQNSPKRLFVCAFVRLLFSVFERGGSLFVCVLVFMLEWMCVCLRAFLQRGTQVERLRSVIA